MHEPFRKAFAYLTLLLFLEVLTGLLIIITTAIYQFILSDYLSEFECSLLHSYLFTVYVFGVLLIISYLCSSTMWKRIKNRRCTPNMRLLLAIWLFYSSVVIAFGFALVWNVYHSVEVLENAAESSLTRGIDMYYSCPEWKLLWDGLQLRKQCCGVHNYKDWMYAEWMPQSPNNTASTRTVMAPYACCKRDCESCFANYMTGPGNSGQPFPKLSLENINVEGCLPNYTESLWNYIYIVGGLTLMAIKSLIFLCCLTKYILRKQNMGEGNEGGGLTDEDGCPLVIVKYPANVRCLTISEDDLASDTAPDIAYCHCNPSTEEPRGESDEY